MIRILELLYLGDSRLELGFSNGRRGVYDAHLLLDNQGSLLEPLRDETYFARVFLDAGTLCWPNGLELSPSRVYEQTQFTEAA